MTEHRTDLSSRTGVLCGLFVLLAASCGPGGITVRNPDGGSRADARSDTAPVDISGHTDRGSIDRVAIDLGAGDRPGPDRTPQDRSMIEIGVDGGDRDTATTDRVSPSTDAAVPPSRTCRFNAMCRDGQVCHLGACVDPGCSADNQCPGDTPCVNRICQPQPPTPIIQTGKSHPFLFFTADEIDAARARIQGGGWAAQVHQDIKSRADSRRASGIETRNDRTSLQPYFEDMDEVGVAYLLSDDGTYATYGRQVLLDARDRMSNTEFASFFTTFAQTERVMSLACLYDAVASTLGAGERNDLEQNLWRPIVARQREGQFNDRDNKGTIQHMGVGVIALLLEDQPLFEEMYGSPVPGQGTTFMWAVLRGFRADGIHEEVSQGYQDYTFRHILPFALAARHARSTPVEAPFQTVPSLLDMYTAYLELAFPHLIINPTADSSWNRSVNLGDAEVLNGIHGNPPQLGYLLTTAYQTLGRSRSCWRQAWNFAHMRDYHDDGSFRPRSRAFDHIGFGVLRHGDGPQAHYAFLDFASGVDNHDHADRLALFVAAAARVPLAAAVMNRRAFDNEGGATIYENSVVIDQAIQEKARDAELSLLAFGSTPTHGFQIVDAEAPGAYPSLRAYQRTLAMVADEYLFDLFTVVSSSGARTLDWVQHRLDPIAIGGNSGGWSGESIAAPGYDHLTALQSTGTSGGRIVASSHSSDHGGMRSEVLQEPGDRLYRGDCVGPGSDTVTHPILFIRRQSAGAQFAALHAYGAAASYDVAIEERFAGAPDARGYGVTIRSGDRHDTLLLDLQGPDGDLVAIDTYHLGGKAGLLRRRAGTVERIHLIDGSELREGGSLYVNTFGIRAHVESEGSLVRITGAVQQFRIFAPLAQQILVNGAPVAFRRDGDFVENN